MLLHTLPLLLLSLPGLSPVGTAEWPPVQVEVGGSYDILSGPHADWQDTWVRVRQPIPPRSAVYGTLLRAQRWGRTDLQIRGGTEFPLGDDLGGHLTAAYSPTHEVLSHWGVGGDLRMALGDGWSAGVGGGFDRYRTDEVTHQFGRLGWRGGDWGVGYRLGAAQATEESGLDHTATITRYYGAGSRISLRGTTGSVLVPAPDVVRIDPINGIGLVGFHLLRPGFGFGYEFGIDDHGTYTRSRIQAGFRIL